MTHPEPQSTEALLEEIASFDVEAFIAEDVNSTDALIAEVNDIDTLIEEVNAQIEADLAAIARGEFLDFLYS